MEAVMRTLGVIHVIIVGIGLAACGESREGPDASIADASIPPDGAQTPDAAQPDAAAPACAGEPHYLLAPSECSGAPPRWDGPLCGPSDRPCRITSEAVGITGVRLAPPSLGVDPAGTPQILARDDSGHAWFALRGEAWSVEPLGIRAGGVSLAYDPDGRPLALLNDLEYGNGVWVRRDCGWQLVDSIAGATFGGPRSLAATSGGCLLASLQGSNDGPSPGPEIAARLETWSLTDLGGTVSALAGPIALAPDGSPQIAWWDTGGSPPAWRLRWTAPPAPAEQVLEYGSSGLDTLQVALAVDASARPHILANRHVLDADGQEVIQLGYAARLGGVWTVLPVAQGTAGERDGDSPESQCGAPFEGAHCTWEFTEVRPIGVVTAGGDVRLIYAQRRHAGDQTFHCDPPDAEDCEYRGSWEGSLTIEGQLYIAWPSDAGVDRAVLTTGFLPGEGSVAVDGLGRIHVVAEFLDEHDLRWLLLEG